jgi:hypothetical protein
LNKLKNGNSKEKVMAADFMGKNKIKEAIPLLISYLDSDEWFLYDGKSAWTLTCLSTVSLEKITGEKFGNTCNEDNSKKKSQIDDIKDSWAKWYWEWQNHLSKTYINETLGFKIKYPEIIYKYFNASCKKENGNDNTGGGFVPVKIFEDNKNKVVYIATEYYYKLNQEGSVCEKIDNTLDLLKENQNPDDFVKWKIVLKDIHNENELNQFIKGYFEEGCKLAEKKPAIQNGVFDVYITGDNNKWGPDEGCWINWMIEFKYYPLKNKIAAWDMGQEYMFLAEPKYYLTFDEEIADSFRFLE